MSYSRVAREWDGDVVKEKQATVFPLQSHGPPDSRPGSAIGRGSLRFHWLGDMHMVAGQSRGASALKGIMCARSVRSLMSLLPLYLNSVCWSLPLCDWMA